MNASNLLLVVALFVLVAVATTLVVQLYRAKTRERSVAAALERAKLEARDAELRAKLVDDQLQQALARLRALSDVEQRYRGVMDLEAFVTSLRAQGITLQAEQTEQRLAHRKELDRMAAEVDRLRHQLVALSDEEYFADFGIYSTRYDFPTSERYRAALDEIRAQQKAAIKAGTAAVCRTSWTVEGSAAKGRKMVNDSMKLMLRAFNGECDAATTKVTYKNVAALEQRIWKAKEQLDRLGAVNQCEVTEYYARLKLEELHLFYEHESKKEAERQEQRELREQMREEQRAVEELEKARKQAEDEEVRYQAALAKARAEAQRAAGSKHAKLEAKIAELEARLLEAQTNKERAISLAQQTRAGHVYVISNIGSFGEGVYKIGMTRRLEPDDRIKELGDASVPFSFDVHARIRSKDAPKLEKDLHRRFADRRVNLVNERKEFFYITLDEVARAVTELHGEVEFTLAAEAAEYRQSVALRSKHTTSATSNGMVSQRPANSMATTVARA